MTIGVKENKSLEWKQQIPTMIIALIMNSLWWYSDEMINLPETIIYIYSRTVLRLDSLNDEWRDIFAQGCTFPNGISKSQIILYKYLFVCKRTKTISKKFWANEQCAFTAAVGTPLC